jgi:hypothetical protein
MLFSWLLWIWRVLRCCCDATSTVRAMATLSLQLRRDFSRWFFSSEFIVTIVHCRRVYRSVGQDFGCCFGKCIGGCILSEQNLYVWFSGGFRKSLLPDVPPDPAKIENNEYFLSRMRLVGVGLSVTCETTYA